MQGSWSTNPDGNFVAGPVAGPFAAVGTLFFDGVNRFGGVATSSFAGHVIFPFRADGAYTLTSDCRLSVFEETLRISFDGWLVNNKSEVVFFEPDSISISINHLRRQNIVNCSLATLHDNWVISTSGYNIITAGRFVWTAHLNFDGKGNITGTASRSDNGVITEDASYVGTYTVGADDCSFSLTVADKSGLNSSYYGSLFDQGRQAILIESDDGIVVRGFAAQQSNGPASAAPQLITLRSEQGQRGHE